MIFLKDQSYQFPALLKTYNGSSPTLEQRCSSLGFQVQQDLASVFWPQPPPSQPYPSLPSCDTQLLSVPKGECCLPWAPYLVFFPPRKFPTSSSWLTLIHRSDLTPDSTSSDRVPRPRGPGYRSLLCLSEHPVLPADSWSHCMACAVLHLLPDCKVHGKRDWLACVTTLFSTQSSVWNLLDICNWMQVRLPAASKAVLKRQVLVKGSGLFRCWPSGR